MLKSLKVGEAIVSFGKQTEVWLPEDRNQGCSIIGKFTQGSKADGKRLTRRLVTDRRELDFLVRDNHKNGTLVGAPEKCLLGYILTYYDGDQPQYAHLRASMLGYAHINLISMLKRFEPEEVVRVATDSLYIQKSALHRLEGAKAYSMPKSGEKLFAEDEEAVEPAQWRDKGEWLYLPNKRAKYFPELEHIKQVKQWIQSAAPCYDDPLARHQVELS